MNKSCSCLANSMEVTHEQHLQTLYKSTDTHHKNLLYTVKFREPRV